VRKRGEGPSVNIGSGANRACGGHVGYLVVLGGIGVIGTARRLEKLLLS
jgi:hypothetical protein